MKGQQRMQWSFSDKASSNVPQLLSFMSASDEQTGKPASRDRMMPSSLQGTGATTYQNRYTHHQSKETRLLPPVQSNNGKMYISMSSISPRHHKYSAPFPAGQNMVANPASSARFVDGVPAGAALAAPAPAPPPSSSMVGTTDLRNNGPRSSPPSSAPAQLTIFYDGSVCVYDDVTPEKARAIMLLAGDGPSRTNSPTIPAAPSPISWAPPRDGYLGDKLLNAISGVVSSSSGPHSTHGIPPPVMVSLVSATPTVGAASSALVSGVAVPQARKASLARFLEKRKERVSSASPYNTTPEKNYPERIIIS